MRPQRTGNAVSELGAFSLIGDRDDRERRLAGS